MTVFPANLLSRRVRDARYFQPGADGGSGRLHVVCAGVEKATPDYRVERSTFPYRGLEYVAAGQGRLRRCGEEYELRPGDVFTYGPGVPHRIETDPDDVLVKYFVDYAGDEADVLFDGTPLEVHGHFHAREPADAQDLFEALIRCGRHGGRRAAEVCVLLLRALVLQVSDAPLEVEDARSPAYATFRRARDHMDAASPGSLTVQELAYAVHVDPAYLCRLFRRFEGRSPYQMMLDDRLRQAAALLREPDALVKNVAADTGFDDPQHFSRMFKQRFGVSPARFAGPQTGATLRDATHTVSRLKPK